MAKRLLISIGILCVILGFVGIFIPLLPTTPFLLLAAACFVRSSEKLYHWLINNRWLGHYIRYYREYKAISLRVKVFTLILLWTVIGFTGITVVSSWWLRSGLAIVALGVTLHILHLNTVTKEMIGKTKINNDL